MDKLVKDYCQRSGKVILEVPYLPEAKGIAKDDVVDWVKVYQMINEKGENHV